VSVAEVNPVTGEEVQVGAGVQRKELSAGGFQWSYLEAGAEGSPTVLLLHGALCSGQSWREAASGLAEKGYRCIAPDWLGHGSSEIPSPASFAFDGASYLRALDAFVQAAGVGTGYVMVTQGFVLGQYGLKYALQNEEDIANLVILSTPLGAKSALPGPLGQLDNPFLKMVAQRRPIDVGAFTLSGGPYTIRASDVEAYQAPFETEAGREALHAMMDALNFKELLEEVSDGFRGWKTDSCVAWGDTDRYLDLDTALEWQEDKRTCIQTHLFKKSCGHFPQTDYPELVVELVDKVVKGEEVNQSAKGRKRVGDLNSAGS
jgi:pimeloyl-ACP methyl ester carboxylesterase